MKIHKKYILGTIIVVVLCLLLIFAFPKKNVFVFKSRRNGLGNQMFFLAAQSSYTKHFKKELCLEKQFNKAFNLPFRLCSQEEIKVAKNKSCKAKRYSKSFFENENCLEFSQGHFQDERYFMRYRDDVKKMFKFKILYLLDYKHWQIQSWYKIVSQFILEGGII